MADRIPPQRDYSPSQYAVPLRAVTQPEVKRARSNGNLKAILASLGVVAGGGGAHKFLESDTRDRAIQTQADLAGHIKQSDERHQEVKAALKVLEDESKEDRLRRAKEIEAMFDALRVPKEKRPK